MLSLAIPLRDVPRAHAVYLVNALRGWVRVEFDSAAEI
jgi:hypothetical protein